MSKPPEQLSPGQMPGDSSRTGQPEVAGMDLKHLEHAKRSILPADDVRWVLEDSRILMPEQFLDDMKRYGAYSRSQGTRNRNIFILAGVPGMGKSTIARKMGVMHTDEKVKMISFGDFIIEEVAHKHPEYSHMPAQELRDRFRDIAPPLQVLAFQKEALNMIRALAVQNRDTDYFVDTHISIEKRTDPKNEPDGRSNIIGYTIGLPPEFFTLLRPQGIISIVDVPEAVSQRRQADGKRRRCPYPESIAAHQSVNEKIARLLETVTGTPVELLGRAPQEKGDRNLEYDAQNVYLAVQRLKTY
jgi:adenylate kinase